MSRVFRGIIFLILLGVNVPALAEVASQDTGILKIHAFASKVDPVKIWFETKPPAAPKFTRIHTVGVNEPFHVAILIHGLKLDEQRNYKGIIDIKIIRPDGEILLSEKKYSQLAGKASDEYKEYLRTFKMVDPALVITMENTDPKGEYLIEATLHDEVSKDQIQAVYKLTLK
ncbi:MAG: hypothetical protein ACK502_05430 [Alphaproteobacteria bacterium]